MAANSKSRPPALRTDMISNTLRSFASARTDSAAVMKETIEPAIHNASQAVRARLLVPAEPVAMPAVSQFAPRDGAAAVARAIRPGARSRASVIAGTVMVQLPLESTLTQ